MWLAGILYVDGVLSHTGREWSAPTTTQSPLKAFLPPLTKNIDNATFIAI